MAGSGELTVLFLCTGNSCRSQMAEGWTRHLKGDEIAACSAGVVAAGLDPRAVEVMAEAGVDISGQRSKLVTEFEGRKFDFVVTLCDHARATCPFFPDAGRYVHRAFDDPPSLALDAASEEEMLGIYRRVRDEIREFVEQFPAVLEEDGLGPSSPVGLS
jgi:arsenate reductase